MKKKITEIIIKATGQKGLLVSIMPGFYWNNFSISATSATFYEVALKRKYISATIAAKRTNVAPKK